MRDPDQSCSRASHKCVPASTERSSETDSPSSRNKATDRPFRSSGSGRFSLTIWGARSLESPVGVLAWKNSSKSIKNGRLKHSWLAWWQRPRLHTPSCREARGAPATAGLVGPAPRPSSAEAGLMVRSRNHPPRCSESLSDLTSDWVSPQSTN